MLGCLFGEVVRKGELSLGEGITLRNTHVSMSRVDKENGPVMKGWKRLSPPSSGGFEAVCEQIAGNTTCPKACGSCSFPTGMFSPALTPLPQVLKSLCSLKGLSKPGHSGDSCRQDGPRVCIYKLFQNKQLQWGTRQMSLDLREHPITSHHLRNDDGPSHEWCFNKEDRLGWYLLYI